MDLSKARVLIAEPKDFSPIVMARLRQHVALEVKTYSQVEIKEVLRRIDVLWFRLKYKIDTSVLDEHSSVKIIVTPVTGINHIDESLCAKLNIKIICLRGEKHFLQHIRATAETTVALMFMSMRHYSMAINDTLNGNWNRDKFRGSELYNKKCGIIGYGRLGKIVGDYCTGFGMDVSAYDIDETLEIDPRIERKTSLEELCGSSDVISLHVNLTSGNHEMISYKEFSWFKPGSYFVNTSRGELVNESALIEALSEGKLAGAAIDVIQNEYSINKSDLLRFAAKNDTLIITPHLAGNTYESFERTEAFMCDKLFAALNIFE